MRKRERDVYVKGCVCINVTEVAVCVFGIYLCKAPIFPACLFIYPSLGRIPK